MKNLVKLVKSFREDIIAIEIVILTLLLIWLSVIVSMTRPVLGPTMFILITLAFISIDWDLE